MTNHEIAQRFQQIADTLEIQGENPFKVRAYRKAVDAIEQLTEPLVEIERRGELEEIPGFGEAIAAKTRDFLTKGTTKLYEQIKDAVPAGVLKMAATPGIGPKTAKHLWEALGVTSIDALERAAKEGKVQSVPGFGAAKEKSLLKAIDVGRRLAERVPLYTALPYAERLADTLARRPEVRRAEAAGSVRRRCDTVGDFDLVVATTDPESTARAVAELPGVTEVLQRGNAHVSAMTDLGLGLDVRLGKNENFGALLHHFSSGQAHNIALRTLAESKGLKINEYGVFNSRSGAEKTKGAEEADIYAALGLPYIEPELREDRGEIEAAIRNELPKLITEEDFRGQLHEHTTWSDGKATVREMAEAAIALGYEYLAITDHSRSLQIANGLSRERLLDQLEEIAPLQRELAKRGFTLLTGIEADILADGSLDCDDDLLERLDIVVGSVHIRHKEDEKAMTERVLKAIENPRLKILGHPTGRLLGKREAFPIDMEGVIDAAVRTGTVLEINASPDRMDLNDLYARRAKEKGARLTINADAHSTEGLGQLRWGLYMARRAWLEPRDVINTFPLKQLRKMLKPNCA